ncbi:S8 family serine peptidase [Aquimarina sp. 2201CG5-10]|uniref:S8 family serine peptidase n=1 Tax=Aquimarina callyspongiae TaxID=3098150 RepID=UPI002AB3E65B|nr:S8 family serine peptidase [Aquimarina sp. 2201CG5-10]MDY8133992.1 S8 family serine peptidase [Aquimarina sp. 2201CG5-10]
MKRFLFFFVLSISQLGIAQTEDAWVYFTDKENVTDALANPITILTQEAIDRKNLHNTVIDARDIPVNESYITQLKNTTGITVLAKSKWFNCAYVRGTQPNIASLSALSFVDRIDYADNSLDSRKSVVENKKAKQPSPNKFKVKTLFNYGSALQQIQQLNAEYLHEQNFTGSGMIIAVMDSGFPGVNTIDGFKRIRDDGRLLDGYDFVSRNADEFAFTGSSHGTQTFSDIAGFIDGQFVGTAPDAKYYLFRTEDVSSEGPKEEALWVEAAERADSLGVDVINTSLGYSAGFDNPAYEYQTSDMDGQTTFITRGANIAFEKGMLLVSSAGNEGGSSWGIITAPGDAPGVLTVGAVNSSGNYASFSSIGPTADNRVKPDVVARGASAAVILSNNSVSSSNGTSFSSPIMAGAVTCLWQAFPSMTNAEIMQLVRASGSLFNNPTNQLGYGIPNFKTILENLAIGEEVAEGFRVYPNPVRNRLFIDLNTEKKIKIRIFTLEGKIVKSEELSNTKYISLQDLSTGLYMVEINTDNIRHTLKISKY